MNNFMLNWEANRFISGSPNSSTSFFNTLSDSDKFISKPLLWDRASAHKLQETMFLGCDKVGLMRFANH